MIDLTSLSVKIFADGADLSAIETLAGDPLIKGVTTNPTLMRKAGVTSYERFARAVLEVVPDKPVSFEVFADDFAEMELQAREIASWAPNVTVKIPVTNSRGDFSGPLIERLSRDGIKLNVTALLTLDQVRRTVEYLDSDAPSIVSIFAGRIADTGRDPVPVMAKAVGILSERHPNAELLWASPRELLNIFQADSVGCQIITATSDILGKLPLVGRELTEYSRETVAMFYEDARAGAFRIHVRNREAAE